MSSTPANPRLPRMIDVRKFAQQGIHLAGDVPVSGMERLAAESLNSDQATVAAVLEFGVDEERHRLIRGTADCSVQVTCQRCLEPVEVALHADINLAIVWDEEKAKQLVKSLDPLIVGEGPADLYAIIEDELLLELPIASYHDHDCIAQTSFGEEVEDTGAKSSNPFQVLEQLKGSPKS
ncbi:YceD family protein [Pseudomaricurvus sp. HS19]|uniref:YceD family protein n=1 Tax=Pseudomaricurvus sp. HS19 TaxID=2692626 RepID=UPI00136EA903|nr:YceD family protein [Pseudomaricurvus sp. HS19]MYM62171.1 nucleic acid-binding protein [Pseudomaricurvus sp. HS19]